MKKKVFVPLIVILISGLLLLNYWAYKSPEDHKMIAQKTVYSLGNTKTFTISLYSNYKGAYQLVEAVDVASIENSSGTKKLAVKLENITKSNQYQYLDETYHKYLYHIELPDLNDYFYIEEAYFNLRLKNGEETKFMIGSFDYYQPTENTLNLTELYGRKNTSFPSLDQVSLRFEVSEPIYIEYLVISSTDLIPVNQMVRDDSLIQIDISPINKTFNQLSFKLIYSVGDNRAEEILPYYLFYETIENPLDYGVLNHVYLFD
jgi:hypothetical protein